MHCQQKEQDTFPTTYAKDYVWHENTPEISLFSNFDAFALTKDEKKAFIDLNAIKDIPWEEKLEIIKNLYAQRMKTVYHVSYCEKGKSERDPGTTAVSQQDPLVEAADRLYSKKSQKVLEPVPTSRRVMGSCRPAYYYTGLSEYQDEYSRQGYQALLPTRNTRLKQRLPFCDQLLSKGHQCLKLALSPFLSFRQCIWKKRPRYMIGQVFGKEELTRCEPCSVCVKQDQESQTWTDSDKSQDELVSVFVRTSQNLQEMVQGYESKVNQTTDYISCLQGHISLLHDQLTHKNKLIGRMCDRYVALCKEKQTSEDHLQRKVDELSAVVEGCLSSNASQLQRLLIQQVNRCRLLEYQNESLAQQVTRLCRDKLGS